MDHKYYKTTKSYYDALQDQTKRSQLDIPNLTETEVLVCIFKEVVGAQIDSQYEITEAQYYSDLQSSAWRR